MFMWPTSELPIWPAGRPTARPDVASSACGLSAQHAGVVRRHGRSDGVVLRLRPPAPAVQDAEHRGTRREGKTRAEGAINSDPVVWPNIGIRFRTCPRRDESRNMLIILRSCGIALPDRLCREETAGRPNPPPPELYKHMKVNGKLTSGSAQNWQGEQRKTSAAEAAYGAAHFIFGCRLPSGAALPPRRSRRSPFHG